MPSLPHQVNLVVLNYFREEVEGATLTITHSSGVLSASSDPNGEYVFNLAELSSWSVGDALTIVATKSGEGTVSLSTTVSSGGGQSHTLIMVVASTYSTETEGKVKALNKTILVNPNAVDYNSEFPLPVRVVFSDDRPLTKRMANQSFGQSEYMGLASVGAKTSDARWLIKKLEYDDGEDKAPTAEKFASAKFDKVWDDRTIYDYS